MISHKAVMIWLVLWVHVLTTKRLRSCGIFPLSAALYSCFTLREHLHYIYLIDRVTKSSKVKI